MAETKRRSERALGMIRLRVRGGAGLAPAAGLIRSLSAERPRRDSARGRPRPKQRTAAAR